MTDHLSDGSVDTDAESTDGHIRRRLSDYIALGSSAIPNGVVINYTTVDATIKEWKPIKSFEYSEVNDKLDLLDALAPLLSSGWIRAFANGTGNQWRIYLLADDVARSTVDGRGKKHAKALQTVLIYLTTSVAGWHGSKKANDQTSFDLWASPVDCSLFYLFNTLPSPSPRPDSISNVYLRHSVERLLESDRPPWGLKTSLHPYQRRCAAMMIQKENVQSRLLDPRLEERQSPNGETYYYGPRDGVFYKDPRFYESCSGGILAETMGLGKTLICIAVIMATRGQYPEIPFEYTSNPTHTRVRSLADMAATAAVKTGLPYKTYFEDHQNLTDNDLMQCKAIMDRQRPTYDIPPRVIRSMRHSEKRGPAETVRLCHGTIVVIPPNLVHQWQAELSKHIQENALKVVMYKDAKVELPPPDVLAGYDIILFSKRRFELENRSYTDVDYVSPLKKLHWLRIIIDEGHGFSSSATNAAVVAEKLVRAERRWVVTGTPARDLLGVEVDVSAMVGCETDEDFRVYREASLANKKQFDETQERTSGAVRSIGALASRFLKAKPWSLALSEEGNAHWDEYVYRHEEYFKRTYSCFSRCLQTTLTDLMIKTQPEDVYRDIKLPPLRHDIIRLEPSLVDKMTANLFILLYTTNAVTSERRDQDYLFHTNSRKHLQSLTSNLRQSSFFWNGFVEKDVLKSIETGYKYLAKDDTNCTEEDRALLTKTMTAAHQAVSSPAWKALAASQEMGMFAGQWPEKASLAWAFEECLDPPMIGLAQVIEAQKYVNNQLATDDPMNGFEDLGFAAKLKAQEEEQALAEGTLIREGTNLAAENKAGIPVSAYNDSMGSKRVGVKGTSKASPKKRKSIAGTDSNTTGSPATPKPTPPKKRKLSIGNTAIDLDSRSPLGRTQIIGTASSKFSYLIDRVSALHEDEKILIFYDADHVAYYLSQAFDLLHIKHLIYAKTLSPEQRSKYIVLFNEDPAHRVLIMDLKQAAHGLNLSSASRVFFVNPPWRPDVEAQAIKRAHRIGQTKPVHVETLVLKDTVEEAMYERTAKMTQREHREAKTLEEDADIRSIIQNAKVLEIKDEELQGGAQMAPLGTPQQIFGRPGRAGKSRVGRMEEEVFGGENEGGKRRKGKGKVRFVEAREPQRDNGVQVRVPDPVQAAMRSRKGRGTAKRTKKANVKSEPEDDATHLEDAEASAADAAPGAGPDADANEVADAGAVVVAGSSRDAHLSLFGG